MTWRTVKRYEGAALLLVLWAMGMICIAMVGLTQLIQITIGTETELSRIDRARHLAESGLAILATGEVENGDPILKQTILGDGRYAAHMEDEGGRLQINFLLQSQDRTVLSRLFSEWGLDAIERDTVIDSLQDWVNPLRGGGRRINGAGMDDYKAAGLPYGPTGEGFISLDQMMQVLHMDLLMRKKTDWKRFFTVWTDGSLDINAAPADLLAAATGASLSKAKEMVSYRLGPDGVQGSEDDIRFGSLDAARQFLGVPPQVWNSTVIPLRLDSAIKRMICTGKSGAIEVTLSMVVNRAVLPPAVLDRQQP